MAKENLLDNEVLVKRIKDNLLVVHIEFDSLSENEKKAFLKVGAEIDRRMDKKKQLMQEIKSNAVNINSIAKSGIISNKTIYNYPRLVGYIKYFESRYLEGVDKNAKAGMKEELEHLKELLKQFDDKVLDVSLYDIEVRSLDRKLNDYEAKINAMQEVIEKLEYDKRKLIQSQKEIQDAYNKGVFIN